MEHVFKSVTSIAASFLLLLTGLNPAFSLDSPWRSQAELIAYSSTKEIKNPKVFALANGSTLVSWQEISSGYYYQKVRTISSSNKLGAVQTLNLEQAIPIAAGDGVIDSIAINKQGRLFAIWVTQGLRYGVQSQKIWGRTSSDGTSWSKPFVIVSGLTVSGDQRGCEMDSSAEAGCGYIKVQAAIDGKNRLAVLVADNHAPIGNRYRMKATSFVGKWQNFKTLTATRMIKGSHINGLSSGFAVNATRYDSASSNSVRVSYFDPLAESWIGTLTGLTIAANTVINSQWVQRDLKNLTLAMASSNDEGGITVRNFSISSKMWVSEPVQIQAHEIGHVYQNVLASKVGSDLVLLYNAYNQDNGQTEVRATKITGANSSTAILDTSEIQIDLLYLGATSTAKTLVGYNQVGVGAKFGGITESDLPSLLPNSASNGYLSAMIKAKDDSIYAVGLKFEESKTSVVFTKGLVN